MESARIIVFHESIGGKERIVPSMETIKPRRKECIEGTRPISTFHERNLSKSSNLSFLPPSYSRPRFIPRIDASPLLPRVYLTSRYKIHFIATGTTNRYFSFLGTGSQSDKRMTRRLQPAARCNKWI